MTPLYEQLCAKFSWPVDDSLVETMRFVDKERAIVAFSVLTRTHYIQNSQTEE